MNKEKCKLCKDFCTSPLHDSHNVPKYMGGTEKDGFTRLCQKCHAKYEKAVLKAVLERYLKIELDFSYHSQGWYMAGVRELPEELKIKCREVAREVYKEWFN